MWIGRACVAGEDAGDTMEKEFSAATQVVQERLRQDISALRELAEEKTGAHERLKAEAQSFRRRALRELAGAQSRAVAPVIEEFLPIVDEVELAMRSLPAESDGERLIVGRFQALFGQMMKTWKALGVERVPSVGRQFDPELHEAVSLLSSSEYAEQEVCSELRAGFVLRRSGDGVAPDSARPHVLRPALVCVSSGPGPA